MRYSRGRKKRTTPKYAGFFLFIVIAGTIFYFGTAGMMGNWVAKNFVSPILNSLNNVKNPLVGEKDNDTDQGTDKVVDTKPDLKTESIDISGLNIYCIQMNAFSSSENAKIEAKDVQSKGGAGYIIEDKLFRVMASAYGKESDAIKVKDQLKSDKIDSKIYPLTIKGVNIQITADANKTKEVKDAFTSWQGIAGKIGSLSINFDKDNMDVDEAKKQIKNIKAEVESVKSALERYNQATEGNEIFKGLKKLYDDTLTAVEVIDEENFVKKIDFSSKIKYTYIEMVDQYSKYMNDISG